MISANFGYHGLIKYILERDPDLNAKDQTGFTALTYAIKMERISIAIYLILKGAKIDSVDVNECTLAHWAAYKNNLFLLKVLKNLGVSLS
mgnify:CR=1 FL=1